MKIFNLAYVNFKRMIKDPVKVGMMFIMPIVVIIFSYMLTIKGPSASSNLKVAYNVEDRGDLGILLYEASSGSKHLYINDKTKAIELLEKNDVTVVYNIPENFTEMIKNGEKPTIDSYKREEGNITIPLENELNGIMNRLVKEELLLSSGIIKDRNDLYVYNSQSTLERKDVSINMDYFMTVNMMIYFIFLSTSSIGVELIDFKKKNILSRSMSTPNSSGAVIGALALSILVLQVSANIIIILLAKIVMGFSIENLLVLLINIILASLFSITLSMTITRIFNNEGTANIVTVLVVILSLYLSMYADKNIYSNVPSFISNLGKFTPQYWIKNSIEKSKLFPNAFVSLLMIISLFTAGSYKFKNFVNR